MTDRRHGWRLALVGFAVLAGVFGLAVRLVHLHTGPHADRLARINRVRRLVRDIPVARGRIMDCNGSILAMDVSRVALCADPSLVLSNRDARAVADALQGALGVDGRQVLERLDNPRLRFAYLLGYGRYLDADAAGKVSGMGVEGLFCRDVMDRFYPRGSQMCHAVGFVNLERRGSAGIEQKLDEYLRGVPGLVVSELDGQRREMPGRRSLEMRPRRGADVVLTLDQYVQYVVENALDRAMEAHRPAAAWAIVQRVRTGEILAMASRPGFDPNEVRGVSAENMRNRCVSCVYEPGSTFKITIVSAALNEGLVAPNDVYDCEGGAWIYQNRPLRDFHPYDRLTVADVIKKSSNIGAAKIALKLGPARMYAYLKAFGIGSATGIELPGEEAGLLAHVSKWSALSPTRIAIGHEVAVTALQMLNAMCAIANDGVLMKPYIVRQVIDCEGRILLKQEPVALGRPIRPETARTMRELLVRVTEEGGTGVKARVEGFTVGGKTGTAQKAVAGGYSDSLNIASFAGFIPAESPELGIIVVLDEPRDFHTGGAVAAPAFREIAEQAVRYLDIPPLGRRPAMAGDRALERRNISVSLAAFDGGAGYETRKSY